MFTSPRSFTDFYIDLYKYTLFHIMTQGKKNSPFFRRILRKLYENVGTFKELKLRQIIKRLSVNIP